MRATVQTVDNSTTIDVIGKIKIGKKIYSEKSKCEIPVSLDYFLATGKYANHFHNMYGRQPNLINIVFISDNLFDVCYERYELRDKKLYGYGDGSNFYIYNNKKNEYEMFLISDYPNIMDMAEKKYNCKWSHILTLRFFVPGINIYGVWQLDTRGEATSIKKIVSTILKMQEMNCSIINIPFDLSVQKIISQNPSSKNSYPVLSLIPNMYRLDEIKEKINSGFQIAYKK
jgi:hypothetical protein